MVHVDPLDRRIEVLAGTLEPLAPVDDVALHPDPGRLAVTGGESRMKPAVGLEQTRRAARRSLENHLRGRVDEQAGGLARKLEHPVARRLGDQRMKLGVEFGEDAGVVEGRLGAGEVVGDGLQLRRGDALGGQPHRGHLEGHRGLVEFAEGDFVQQQGAADAAGQLGVAGQAGVEPAAAVAPDQPALLEQADALAHRRAVDAELLDQRRLGPDALARLDAAAEDFALDGVRDELIGRRRLNPLKPLGHAPGQ